VATDCPASARQASGTARGACPEPVEGEPHAGWCEGRGRKSPGYPLYARQLAPASTHPYQVCTCHMCSSGSLLPELFGEPDENSFGAPDVAEPIRVFVLDHFADELRAAFAESGERIVDVLHGEHDA
jgi:hypothetical protein